VTTPDGYRLSPLGEYKSMAPIQFDRDLNSLRLGPLSQYGRGSSKDARFCFSMKMWRGPFGYPSRSSDPSNVECIGNEPRPPAPLDLWVSKIEVSQGQGVTGCLPGKSNIVVASVNNAGDIPLNSAIPVELKVDGTPVQTLTMGGIEKQQTRELAFTGVDIPAGGHALTATVDPTGQFAEAQDGNNATTLNVTCTAPKPDLMVTRVTGPASLDDGATAVYEVVLWNEGAPAKNTAQLLIGFMGPLEPGDLVSTPDGFSCELGNLGYSCKGSLGGQDDPMLSRGAAFQVQARGNGAGKGAVYGSANHDRSLDEVSVDDNLKLLDVTVP
jgi:hypothetical protein